MFCTNCGKKIRDTAAFCPFCGNKTDNSSAEQDKRAVPISAAVATVSEPVKKNIALRLGQILSIIGVGVFCTIACVGVIAYGHVYFYNGYNLTKILCTVCIGLMIIGAFAIVCGILLSRKKEFADSTKRGNVLSVVLVGLALICSTVLIVNGINNSKSKSKSSGSSSSYSSSYKMDHSTYCLLYMKVSNVKVTHKGNYTYVSGMITNNGTSQIKYVKVKASCKNAKGAVIDTDWTYAVDSTWLSPGESKNFEMMIKDESNKIKTATVSVVYE